MKYIDFKQIVENSEIFYSSIQEYKGYQIESFSYRLGTFNDFDNNIKKEMRGISFIYWKEIIEPKIFTLGIHKFFNYWEGNTLSLIKNKKIVSVNDKLDGSLIMFWKTPDWEIVAKSKTTLFSDVSIKATNFLNKNKNIKEFVSDLLDKWLFPIFEYVWLDNQIVILYNKSDLVLLAIRDINWKYLDYLNYGLEKNNIKYSPFFDLTLENILKKQETDDGYEGFIITFEDWDKMKLKLRKYVEKHKNRDWINNIKSLIKVCLDEKADDIRTLFLNNPEILDKINKVEEKVFHYFNHIKNETDKIIERDKNLNKKDFAIKNNKERYFGILMNKFNQKEDIDTWIKKIILEDKTFIWELESL